MGEVEDEGDESRKMMTESKVPPVNKPPTKFAQNALNPELHTLHVLYRLPDVRPYAPFSALLSISCNEDMPFIYEP
jgi:hypothetical protein